MAKRSGCSFLQLLMTMGGEVVHKPGCIQIINSINDYQYEKFISCNNTENHILQKGDKDIVWELKGVNTNKEPLVVSHPNYKGVCCNVTF